MIVTLNMTPPSAYSAFLIAMAVSAARRILDKVLAPARENPGKTREDPVYSPGYSPRNPVDLSLVRSSDSFSMYFASARDSSSSDGSLLDINAPETKILK